MHDALVGYYRLGPDGTVTQYLDYLKTQALRPLDIYLHKPRGVEVSVHTIDQIIISVVVITLGLAI